MTFLADGQSEFDVIKLMVVDSSIEITDVESFWLHSSVLTPTDAFKITVDIDDATTAQLLNPGVKVQIAVNDRLALTGYIDKKTIQSSRKGTQVTIEGRDILGPVIDSNINPYLRFVETQTAADLFATVLAPFGINTLYNDGSFNINLLTGIGQKPKQSTQAATIQVAGETIDQGSGKISTAYTSTPVNLVNGAPPGLKTLQLQSIQPQHGAGAFAEMDKIAKRYGIRIHAAADGSGIIFDAPNFSASPTHSFIHRISDGGVSNNLKSAECTFELDGQPSVIIATCAGALDSSVDQTRNYVIAVNELVGTNADGTISQPIKDIIAQYPGATVLSLRPQLTGFRKGFADTLLPRPLFLKDSTSRDINQLSGFARREMANKQHKALHLKVSIEGLSQDNAPFCSDTMVSFEDEVLGISQNLYVLEREFTKSRSGGSSTNLTLCYPYTLGLTV